MGKKNLIFPSKKIYHLPFLPHFNYVTVHHDLKEKRRERKNASLPSESPNDKTTDKHQ
jgi:hypothetical protein